MASSGAVKIDTIVFSCLNFCGKVLVEVPLRHAQFLLVCFSSSLHTLIFLSKKLIVAHPYVRYLLLKFNFQHFASASGKSTENQLHHINGSPQPHRRRFEKFLGLAVNNTTWVKVCHPVAPRANEPSDKCFGTEKIASFSNGKNRWDRRANPIAIPTINALRVDQTNASLI
ncbi:hypothetical protein ACT691_01280 [Vibrio metschnikovii]